MRTDMRGKDFVTLMDYTGEELQTILDVAFDLKRQNAMGAEHELLKNKTLGMIFAQPSTRTRVSFETGMTQLGFIHRDSRRPCRVPDWFLQLVTNKWTVE